MGVGGDCSPARNTDGWLLAIANGGATGEAGGVIAETTGNAGAGLGDSRSGDLQIGHALISAE